MGAYARGDAVFGEFILLLAALTLPLLPVSLVLLQITFELSVMVLAVVKGRKKSLDRHKPLTKVRKDDAELAAVRDAFLAKLVPPGVLFVAVIGIESPRDGAALFANAWDALATRLRRGDFVSNDERAALSFSRARPTDGAAAPLAAPPFSSPTAGRPRSGAARRSATSRSRWRPPPAPRSPTSPPSSARSSSTPSRRWPPTRRRSTPRRRRWRRRSRRRRATPRLGRWTWANIDLHRGFGRLLECARRLAAALAAAPVAVDIDVAADDGWARLVTPPPGGAPRRRRRRPEGR